MPKTTDGLPSQNSQRRLETSLNLGRRLRRLRQRRGLTAPELAKQARITSGFLSQLEQSTTPPSLKILQRIATALEVPLVSLLLEEDLPPHITRSHERHTPTEYAEVGQSPLVSIVPGQDLALIVLELPPGTLSAGLSSAYEGQQCYLVLRGTIRVFYDTASYLLNTGDSILCTGFRVQHLENIGEIGAQLVVALVPARAPTSQSPMMLSSQVNTSHATPC